MKVCISGVTSSEREVLSGVPQCSVLGPLLFLKKISLIGSQLHCKYNAFTDALKLYLKYPSASLTASSNLDPLQHDILYDTASSWGLRFSAEKCSHLRFSCHAHRHPPQLIYTFNNPHPTLESAERSGCCRSNQFEIPSTY